MARTLIGQLILRLKSEGTGEARKVVNTLNDVEAAARRLGQTGATSWGNAFQKNIDKLKLTREEVGLVEKSWASLHDSIKKRSISGALKSSEISNWKTQTLSHLAQTKNAFNQHLDDIEKRAKKHRTRMSELVKPLFVGLGFYTASYGAGLLGAEALGASSERRREIFRQRMANIPQDEQNAIFDRSEQLSQQYPSLPITAIMELARTARNTMGDTGRGLEVLEGLTKMFVTLQSMKGPSAALSEIDGLIRGIDNLGKNGSGQLGIDNTLQIIDAMAKASQIEGDQFDPGKFWQFAKRSKIAGPALSTEFLGAVAPAFMQDLGPDSFGNMLSSAFKAFVIGANDTASKVNLAEQQRLGIRKGDGKGSLVEAELFGRNPYEWVKKHLVPALTRDGVDLGNDTAVAEAVAKLSRNSNATGLLTRMITQRDQVDRLVGLYDGAVGTEVAGDVRYNDPFVGWEAFKKSMENLSAALIPIDQINAGLNSLADGINKLAAVAEDSPLATALGIGAAGVGTYKGVKWGAGKLGDMFGLKSSALALDGSAAALTRAAVALGGSDVVGDLPGGSKAGKVGKAVGGAGAAGVLTKIAKNPAARASPFVALGALAGNAMSYLYSPEAFENIEKNSQNPEVQKRFDFRKGFNVLGDAEARITGQGPSLNKEQLRAQAEAAGKEIESALSVEASPTVNTSSIDAALRKAQALVNTLKQAVNVAGEANANLGAELRRNFADY